MPFVRDTDFATLEPDNISKQCLVRVILNQHFQGNHSRQSGESVSGEPVNETFWAFDMRQPSFIEASDWSVYSSNNLHYWKKYCEKNKDYKEHVKKKVSEKKWLYTFFAPWNQQVFLFGTSGVKSHSVRLSYKIRAYDKITPFINILSKTDTKLKAS